MIIKCAGILGVLLIILVKSFGQHGDTLIVGPKDLSFNSFMAGKSLFLVYNKKSQAAPAEKLVLVSMEVAHENISGSSAFVVNQQWFGADTLVHSAITVLSEDRFSTQYHRYYWRRLGYTLGFDFLNKKIDFEDAVPDSVRSKVTSEFEQSFNVYNLNWHSDLFVFSLLPYKEKRTFRIHFYDPGFGAPTDVYYTVIRQESINNSLGEKIDCWVMETKIQNGTGYQRFWISKKENVVIKEEDFYSGQYRYKLRLLVNEY